MLDTLHTTQIKKGDPLIDPIEDTRVSLRDGWIVAVKSLDGVMIAIDNYYSSPKEATEAMYELMQFLQEGRS